MLQVSGQHDKPLNALALDADRLDLADHRPVLVHLDVSHALEADESNRIMRCGVPAAAVADLGEVDGVEPTDPAKPWISRRLTGFDLAKEPSERLVETAKRRLLRRERPTPLPLRIESPDLLELRRLMSVRDARLRDVPVGITAFLQGAVVEGTVISQHRRQRALLTHGGPREELVRTDHPAHPLPDRLRRPY